MTEQDASADEIPADSRKPGKLRIALRRIGISIGGLFAALILLIGIFVVFGIPIELDWVKGKIETGATDALGRDVSIEGPLTLVPSIPPAAQIEGVRVGNPHDWAEGDLAQLELARAKLRILPLLKGEIVIDEVRVDGLRLNLDTDEAGNPNWLLTKGDEAPTDERENAPETKALKFIELTQLSLSGIAIHRRDAASDKHYELELDEIEGSALDREPMQLRIRGSVQEIPYELELKAGSLADLVEGTAPWALDVTANAAGARLGIHGEIAEPLRGKGIALDFDLAGPSLKNLEALLGTRFPPIQSFRLRGHVQEEGGKYRVVDLEGEVAATGLTGSFEADLSQDRPILNGKIDIRSIDAGPLFAAIQKDEQDLSADSAQKEQPEEESPPVGAPEDPETVSPRKVDLDESVLTLDPLGKLDARFNLTVHEVVNTPTSLRDTSLEILIENGALTAPVSVTFAEVPFKGELRLAPEDGEPRIGLRLGAAQSAIGELARFLLGSEGIEGQFDRVELAFAASGESIRDLIESSQLSFDMSGAALSYGHEEVDGKAVGFTLEEAHMSFPAADESTITAEGSLLGEPFTLEANGGTLIENFIDRSWPIELRATGGGARIDVDGTVRRRHVGQGSEIGFTLAGASIGGLAAWVGVSPAASQSYELSGKATHNTQGLRIEMDKARIGNSSFSGEIGVRRVDDTPVTFAKLDFEVLDLVGLGTLMPAPKEDRERKQGKEALAIDVPILPKGIELFDSDIEIAIARIKLEALDITKVSFASKIKDGYLERAPIALAISGSGYRGELAADLRDEVPTVDLQVRSSKVDVGALLSQLGVAKGIVLTAGDFDLDLALEGSSPREVLTRSSFSVGIGDGLWRIDDPNTEGSLDIRVRKAKIEAVPERPIGLDIDGLIERAPVTIRIATDSLASFAEPKDRLKMDVDVELEKANLSLTGTAPKPVVLENLHFTMDLKGKRLSDFDRLLEVSLPPVGPYRLKGKFGTQRSGYYVKDLQARVGNSSLSGKLDINTKSKPPRLTLDLGAQTIQLDDFATRGWSATDVDADEGSEGKAKPQEKQAGRALLSPKVMRSLNAKVDVSVQRVQSGKDWLGSGKLTATLEDGRLDVDPLTLDLPGGSVDMGFALQPGERDMALEARASIEKLDYGILARRIDPQSETGGIISLDLDLKTRGSDLKHIMQGSNGNIGFALAPKDLNAGIFDLWAVNLFTALMPSLDDDSKSEVNCLVARFGIDDGIMRPTSLLIDSSRIQASGDGIIDFKAETIDFKAKPKSKRPQMFSANTPIQVRGKFSDFKVGLPPGALTGTVFRIVTSPVVVPFKWVFTKKGPADGRVACLRAWSGQPTPGAVQADTGEDKELDSENRAEASKTQKKSRKPARNPSEDVLQPGSGF